ncbi:MAG: hypothetical protein O8C58_04815 [Candidatus Methanoperedens sp.]|nr:hypothetical protein [Candidatus Methanoperedens sp.]
MKLTRKSLISAGCGLVLTAGLIVILVIISDAFMQYFPVSIQKRIPSLIFILSILGVTPFLARKLNRLADIEKILGWTFIGLGVIFIAFPISLFFIIYSAASAGVLIFAVMVLTYSLVFGIPAGFISIAMGIFLIRQHRYSLPGL